jgi:3-phenylpropionate/trans-cinnamate dioxygenase ferredoxin reductase subunit
VPYHRPPLSKTFLSGEKCLEEILIRHVESYVTHKIELLPTTRVKAIDRARKHLSLEGGDELAYDKLALCVGSRPRRFPLPGADLGGIFELRTLADVELIKEHVGAGKKVVVVGGGYIGLETAAVLNKLGMLVTVLEAAPRVMARVTAPEVSSFYQRVHETEGVRIVTGAAVRAFEGQGSVTSVLADGTAYPADFVVVGVGIEPNVELAAGCGLEVRDGIVVDEFARTADPDIVAAGDCTMHPSARYGWLRLESVTNAVEQAKAAAGTLCGKLKAYASLPWFWSDQYDLKLQIAGLNMGYDRLVVRGDHENSRTFSAFYLKGGTIISADCVNRPLEFMLSKRLIAEACPVDADALADDGQPFKALVDRWTKTTTPQPDKVN